MSNSCGDYSMSGLSSYSYGSPYDPLAGFSQSMGGNGTMVTDGWPPPPSSVPHSSHHMQLPPPVLSNSVASIHDPASGGPSSAVAALQVKQNLFSKLSDSILERIFLGCDATSPFYVLLLPSSVFSCSNPPPTSPTPYPTCSSPRGSKRL